jgi:DNA-directed RNA polymerase specialized sigma24 family protein
VATGAHEGTAKSRLRLALSKLASALGTEGVVEWA